MSTDGFRHVTTRTLDLSRSFGSYESRFFGGAGFNYKRTGRLVRDEKTGGFGTNNLKASNENIYLGLTFKLNNN
jgi:hypothetical protein